MQKCVHRFVVEGLDIPELSLSRAGPNEAFGVYFESGKFVLPVDEESEASDAKPDDDEGAVPIGEDKDESDDAEEILNGDQVVGIESTDTKENDVARIAYKSFDGNSSANLWYYVLHATKVVLKPFHQHHAIFFGHRICCTR